MAERFASARLRLPMGILGMVGLTKDDQAVQLPQDNATRSRSAKRRRADAVGAGVEPHIGRALRSVYDETVSEAIPAGMLDLLGKLD